MRFQGAVIKEHGVNFGVIIVKPHILRNSANCEEIQSFGANTFGRMPVILMAQNSRGVPTYYGRPDIVKFLARLHISQIPWREYSVA